MRNTALLDIFLPSVLKSVRFSGFAPLYRRSASHERKDMGGFVCVAHRRKNRGFPTLKRTLNLGIEKGRLLKNSRPKGGLIQVICYPTIPETLDITGFFEKFCIAIRTTSEQSPLCSDVFLCLWQKDVIRPLPCSSSPTATRLRWARSWFSFFNASHVGTDLTLFLLSRSQPRCWAAILAALYGRPFLCLGRWKPLTAQAFLMCPILLEQNGP